MNTRFYKFIIALSAIFFAHQADGQSRPAEKPFSFSLSDSLAYHQSAFRPSKDVYVKNLGLMCRQEWKIEKYLRVPLRIRMGSLEHCNYLEGKK